MLKNRAPSKEQGFAVLRDLNLKGSRITSIQWSPVSKVLAYGGFDKNVQLYDLERNEITRTFVAHQDVIVCLAWSPDGSLLASAGLDRTVKIWEPKAGAVLAYSSPLQNKNSNIASLAWSPERDRLLVVSPQEGMHLLDRSASFREGLAIGLPATCAGFSPDGSLLGVGTPDGRVHLIDPRTLQQVWNFDAHAGGVVSLAWDPDSSRFATVGNDNRAAIWDSSGRKLAALEGHIGSVAGVSFSCGGELLVTKGFRGTVRIWNTDTWDLVSVMEYGTKHGFPGGADFHRIHHLLAVRSMADESIRIWSFDHNQLKASAPLHFTVHYSVAKVVLAGDTGVGKSGLSLVLTNQKFVPTVSTHGHHVRTFDTSEVTLPIGRRQTRETLLWDLAGQPDYRLIHQLHLNDVSVALIVFDARSQTDPFGGVRHWARALGQAQRIQTRGPALTKFLVGARIDVGRIGVSTPRIESIMRDYGIQRYFETSAKEGWGVSELRDEIKKSIQWESVPQVSSTELFEEIKGFLVDEKKKGTILSTFENLLAAFRQKSKSLTRVRNLREQFETCVILIESGDLIRRLSFGGLILMQPEMLDSYASAMISAAKDEPDGEGRIAEEDARSGRFRMPQDIRVNDPSLERLLLTATVEELVLYDIALREPADDGSHILFPSQVTRENPDLPEPPGKSVTFDFSGPTQSIYTTLAVRLSHSGVFKKKEMWKNAVTYSTGEVSTCGIFFREYEEGRGELSLFYGPTTNPETKAQFEAYVLSHLQRRSVPSSLAVRRTLVCESCNTAFSDLQVAKGLELGRSSLTCSVCDRKAQLMPQRSVSTLPRGTNAQALDRVVDAKKDFEVGLISAAGEMQTDRFQAWAGAKRATLALVFTDIVGSTQLANQLGNEEMQVIRQVHFHKGRSFVIKFGGHEVKTIGDALMVAFHNAVDALNFCLAFACETGDKRVRIRCGVHVGAVHIDQSDAFGTMVNFASRVANCAHGNQIMLSVRAKHDIDEERASAHRHLEWKRHDVELKGFAGSQELWSIVATPQD